MLCYFNPLLHLVSYYAYGMEEGFERLHNAKNTSTIPVYIPMEEYIDLIKNEPYMSFHMSLMCRSVRPNMVWCCPFSSGCLFTMGCMIIYTRHVNMYQVKKKRVGDCIGGHPADHLYYLSQTQCNVMSVSYKLHMKQYQVRLTGAFQIAVMFTSYYISSVATSPSNFSLLYRLCMANRMASVISFKPMKEKKNTY